MTTGLNLHILVILCTDLTQLESGAHLAVQLILLLWGEKRDNMSPLAPERRETLYSLEGFGGQSLNVGAYC